MTEAVVVTETELRKAAFDDERPAVRWVPTGPEEKDVARTVRETGSRIAVLGAQSYHDDLYDALADAARGRSALIARYGVGYDGIDLAACANRGILVTTTPGALDRSVAEHAMALLLAVARRVPALEGELRAGRFAPQTGSELGGKTLCVAGLGAIGSRVARMASAGFDMRVIAFGRRPLAERCAASGLAPEVYLARHGLERYTDEYTTAAEACDVLSIHMSAGPSTFGFLSADRLARLRPGAILINTSRGSLVDERALYRALDTDHLRGAGLDVFSHEPYAPDDPACDLRTLRNVVMTPHVGSNTVEANRSMARMVRINIECFLAGHIDEMDLVNPREREPQG